MREPRRRSIGYRSANCAVRPLSTAPSALAPVPACDDAGESRLFDAALIAIRIQVACDSCDWSLYLRRLASGVRAYGNTCGCRLRPVPAVPVEVHIAEAFALRAGGSLSTVPDFLLHQYAERLHPVRIGSHPEEVTCVWNT